MGQRQASHGRSLPKTVRLRPGSQPACFRYQSSTTSPDDKRWTSSMTEVWSVRACRRGSRVTERVICVTNPGDCARNAGTTPRVSAHTGQSVRCCRPLGSDYGVLALCRSRAVRLDLIPPPGSCACRLFRRHRSCRSLRSSGTRLDLARGCQSVRAVSSELIGPSLLTPGAMRPAFTACSSAVTSLQRAARCRRRCKDRWRTFRRSHSCRPGSGAPSD
jgi:hypothetical protein